LGVSGTALAAYNPTLVIANTNHGLGASAPVVIGIGQDENDDATASATVYVPPGYGITLGQAAGRQLGTMSGVVKVASLGGEAREIRGGTLRADNPANYATNSCAPGVHEAVWVLEFDVLGSAYRGQIYVDRVTTGPEAAYAAAKLVVCLPSPYVPPPQGAPSGATLIVAAFSVAGVFKSPATRGSHAWNSVFVPYTPSTATPNTGNAAQSTSFVRLPVQFALNVKRRKRGKRTFAFATACVREAGQAIRGVRVLFYRGPNTRRARRVASARTNSRGCVTTRIRVNLRAVVIYGLIEEVPARQSGSCRPLLVPRCSEASIAPAFDLLSVVRRVRR
jgi:hypothetical protein